MIIHYDKTSGVIRRIYFERDKSNIPLLHDFNSFELDEITENKLLISSLIKFTQSEYDLPHYKIIGGKVFLGDDEIIIVIDNDKKNIKDQYDTAVARLLQIENASNPNNAQVIQAVRDIAKFLRLLLIFIAKRLLL